VSQDAPDSSTVMLSSATAVEGDVPPARPVEATGSLAPVAPTVTFMSPSHDTSGARDPSPVTTSSAVVPTTNDVLETRTPLSLAAPTVGPLEL
jgi:hypothetical protein